MVAFMPLMVKAMPIKRCTMRWLLSCLLACQVLLAHAQPLAGSGTWYEAVEHDGSKEAWHEQGRLKPVASPAKTGGYFIYKAAFDLAEAGHYVIDFDSSSVIGHFTHHIYNAAGEQVAALKGGIQSRVANPYMLRHGRDLMLPAGHYELVSEVSAPFFLAHPQPYIATLPEYQQSIKFGNAVVLVSYGAMLILAIYYAALGYIRKQAADRMYALFILGNIFYNGTALLILPDLFGVHWFYLISFPILFSNIAYVYFVIYLLELRRYSDSKLCRLGRGIIFLLALFIPVAMIWPNISLELARVGVGLIMLYGLTAGIRKAWRGNLIAKYYLGAISAFFVIGAYSITNTRVSGSQTFYIEHLGMLAVTVEMVLLALVLARQFALLNHEKEHALTLSKRHLKIAHTDALTELPNRYALDQELSALPVDGVLVFIDIDGLKFYNDNYGHKRGDELLRSFAYTVNEALGELGVLHRIGGDEFAITSPQGNVQKLEACLARSIDMLRKQGFEFAGMSYGIAHAMESRDSNMLKYLADTRMYAQKRERQRSAEQHPRKTTTIV